MPSQLNVEAQLGHGRVVETPEQADGRYVVAGVDNVILAQRASGCLLAPQPGDLVLLSPPVEGVPYILSVLQASAPESRLETEGTLVIESRRGAIRLKSREGLELLTPKVVLVAAGEFIARSGMVRFLAETVESVATRLLSRCRNALRVVEEAESVDAGSLSCTAKRQITLRAKVARVLAEDLAKVDGDQIQLG